MTDGKRSNRRRKVVSGARNEHRHIKTETDKYTTTQRKRERERWEERYMERVKKSFNVNSGTCKKTFCGFIYFKNGI